MKKYHDIQNLRDKDVDLGNGVIRKANTYTFEKGDQITITEKIDGANASICYDPESGQVNAFSRKMPLDGHRTLNGFYEYSQRLDKEKAAKYPNATLFGEWMQKQHKIAYNEDMPKWIVYSAYDDNEKTWLAPDKVKDMANDLNVPYVHEYYEGPFISWDHCREFLNDPGYGDKQEGIVIRNVDKINTKTDSSHAYILKIVNQEFKESKIPPANKTKNRVEYARQEELLKGVVTEARVSKMLMKLADEGILPNEITPQDMGLIAKNVPRMVYEDIVKEEPEVVEAAGAAAGKVANRITMQIARNIILGS